MADYTNETEGCARSVVYAVDVLDENRALLQAAVSLDETLRDCGCGPQKCALLQSWVNKKRAHSGRDPLPGGSIASETTIREVIGHVCS